MPITYVKKRNNTQNDMGTLFSSNRKNDAIRVGSKRKRCYALCDETDDGQLHTCRKVCEMEMVAEPVSEAACTRAAIASMPEHVVTGQARTRMVVVDGTHATHLPTGCMVGPYNEILYNQSDNQDSKFAGAGVVGRVCQRGGEHWIADYGMGCDSPTARAHWQMDEPMCEKYTRELYPNSKYSLEYSPPDNVSGCVYDPVTNIATYREHNAKRGFDERGLHTSEWQRICIASDGKPFSTEPGAYCPGEEDLHGRLKLYFDETWMREKEETAKAASVDPPIPAP